MPTQTRAEASRANGAKSKGPKSEETRAKSSANALRHGLTASSRHNILLSCEDADEFQALSDKYQQLYVPTSVVEVELVKDMISARWRIQRLWVIEATLLDGEMDNLPSGEFDGTPEPDGAERMAQSFRRLTDGSRALSLISRYEARLHRIHDRAIRTLRELRESPVPAKDVEQAPPPPPVQPVTKMVPVPLPAQPPPPPKENKNAKTNPSPVVPFPVPAAENP